MSVAGIVLLTRHGDRQGFYQSPTTYTAKSTNLTVLGYQQEYKNGQDLRTAYFAGDNAIQGMSTEAAQGNQLRVMADAGGEGTVIVDSSNALLQGLYPPYNDSLLLANGSTVSWNRAQLLQVETIESDQSVWLEGWTNCDAFQTRLNNWYDSSEFKAQAKIANPFFSTLTNVVGTNRPLTLENAWNLFDFLNVESIHNSTLAPLISASTLAQARYWADYHESGSFTDSDLSNVGNIAGQAILPPLLSGINDIANTTNPIKFVYLSASYKPFLALAKLLALPDPLSTSVVDYAASAIFEVRTDNTVRFLFRNGSTEDSWTSYPMLGRQASSANSVSISDFESALQPYNLPTLADWCDKCSTTDARGCSALAQLNGTGGAGYASVTSTMGRHHVSPVVGGVIGAMVTLALVAVGFAIFFAVGPLRNKRRNGRSSGGSDHGSSVDTRTNGHHHLEEKTSAP